MRRRDFPKTVVGGAIGTAGALSPEVASAAPKQNTLMHVGGDYHSIAGGPRADITGKANLEYNLRHGVRHLTGQVQHRLVIDCAGGPEYPTLGEDESYTLDVSGAEARIQAATAEGAIHGLATFAQLIQPGPDGFQVAGVHIEDRPRFPWRGLMLDVCRHWMPVEVVKRNLDAMAAVKLNVLHWHLSEDQGFRVESKRFPRLHELGSNGDYYTQDQIRDIVAYARDRGIRVIPEFDVPGHSGAWFAGYPELASTPGPFAAGRTGRVGDGPVEGEHLRVPRWLHRRDDAAVSRIPTSTSAATK